MAKQQDERTLGEIRDGAYELIAQLGEQYETSFDALLGLMDGRHRTLDALALKTFIETKGLQFMYRPGYGAIYLYRDEGYHELLDRPRMRELLIGLLVEIQMQYRLLDQLMEDLPKRKASEVFDVLPPAPQIVDRTVDGLLKALPTLFSQGEVGENAMLVNLKNGYLDLGELKNVNTPRDLTLHAHICSVFRPVQLTYDFNPNDRCPTWFKFLNEALPNKRVQGFLQEFIGYLLVPTPMFEAALFLIGVGGTGKSTVAQMVQALLGSANCSSVSFADLEERFKIHELNGKLANITTEVCPDRPIKEDVFKRIVSGESILVEQKYKDAIEMRPYARWIVAMNDFPKVRDRTNSFYRRCYMLSFEQMFSNENPLPEGAIPEIPGTKEQILRELPGILVWALEGLIRLVKRGKFDPPSEVRANVRAFQRNNSHVSQFLAERCDIDAADINKRVKTTLLYEAYCEWCATSRVEPLSPQMWGKQILDCIQDRPEATGRARADFLGSSNGDRLYKGVTLRGPNSVQSTRRRRANSHK